MTLLAYEVVRARGAAAPRLRVTRSLSANEAAEGGVGSTLEGFKPVGAPGASASEEAGAASDAPKGSEPSATRSRSANEGAAGGVGHTLKGFSLSSSAPKPSGAGAAGAEVAGSAGLQVADPVGAAHAAGPGAASVEEVTGEGHEALGAGLPSLDPTGAQGPSGARSAGQEPVIACPSSSASPAVLEPTAMPAAEGAPVQGGPRGASQAPRAAPASSSAPAAVLEPSPVACERLTVQGGSGGARQVPPVAHARSQAAATADGGSRGGRDAQAGSGAEPVAGSGFAPREGLQSEPSAASPAGRQPAPVSPLATAAAVLGLKLGSGSHASARRTAIGGALMLIKRPAAAPEAPAERATAATAAAVEQAKRSRASPLRRPPTPSEAPIATAIGAASEAARRPHVLPLRRPLTPAEAPAAAAAGNTAGPAKRARVSPLWQAATGTDALTEPSTGATGIAPEPSQQPPDSAPERGATHQAAASSAATAAAASSRSAAAASAAASASVPPGKPAVWLAPTLIAGGALGRLEDGGEPTAGGRVATAASDVPGAQATDDVSTREEAAAGGAGGLPLGREMGSVPSAPAAAAATVRARSTGRMSAAGVSGPAGSVDGPDLRSIGAGAASGAAAVMRDGAPARAPVQAQASATSGAAPAAAAPRELVAGSESRFVPLSRGRGVVCWAADPAPGTLGLDGQDTPDAVAAGGRGRGGGVSKGRPLEGAFNGWPYACLCPPTPPSASGQADGSQGGADQALKSGLRPGQGPAPEAGPGGGAAGQEVPPRGALAAEGPRGSAGGGAPGSVYWEGYPYAPWPGKANGASADLDANPQAGEAPLSQGASQGAPLTQRQAALPSGGRSPTHSSSASPEPQKLSKTLTTNPYPDPTGGAPAGSPGCRSRSRSRCGPRRRRGGSSEDDRARVKASFCAPARSKSPPPRRSSPWKDRPRVSPPGRERGHLSRDRGVSARDRGGPGRTDSHTRQLDRAPCERSRERGGGAEKNREKAGDYGQDRRDHDERAERECGDRGAASWREREDRGQAGRNVGDRGQERGDREHERSREPRGSQPPRPESHINKGLEVQCYWI